MNARRFTASSIIPAPLDRVWRFHLEPDALERLSPPLAPCSIVDPGNGVANGSELILEAGRWPLRFRWHALHLGVRSDDAGAEFTDVALASPFRYWVHHHRLEAHGLHRTRLTDTVWYLPPPWLSTAFTRPLVTMALRGLFWWRHRQTRRAVEEGGRRRDTTNTNRLHADPSPGG